MKMFPWPPCHLEGALGCEEGTLQRRGLCDIDIRQQVAGGQGAVVPHGPLLLQSLEDEGDEAIHFCSHAMQGKGRKQQPGRVEVLERYKSARDSPIGK